MGKWDAAKCISHMCAFRASHLLLSSLPWLLPTSDWHWTLTLAGDVLGCPIRQLSSAWWKSWVVHPSHHPLPSFPFHSSQNTRISYILRDPCCLFLMVFCPLEPAWKVLCPSPHWSPHKTGSLDTSLTFLNKSGSSCQLPVALWTFLIL